MMSCDRMMKASSHPSGRSVLKKTVPAIRKVSAVFPLCFTLHILRLSRVISLLPSSLISAELAAPVYRAGNVRKTHGFIRRGRGEGRACRRAQNE